MFKLNAFLKENNVDLHPEEINRKVDKDIQNKSIPTEENISFFAIYKTGIGSKYD